MIGKIVGQGGSKPLEMITGVGPVTFDTPIDLETSLVLPITGEGVYGYPPQLSSTGVSVNANCSWCVLQNVGKVKRRGVVAVNFDNNAGSVYVSLPSLDLSKTIFGATQNTTYGVLGYTITNLTGTGFTATRSNTYGYEYNYFFYVELE